MNHSMASEDIAASPHFRHLSTIAGIEVDLRYATPNNFVGRDLYSPYDCAWLHVDAAAALEQVVAWLAERAPTYRILVLDALRPQRVQQQLWDALAGTDLQMYLANPERGSIHSFGMALDLTILDDRGPRAGHGHGLRRFDGAFASEAGAAVIGARRNHFGTDRQPPAAARCHGAGGVSSGSTRSGGITIAGIGMSCARLLAEFFSIGDWHSLPVPAFHAALKTGDRQQVPVPLL